MTHLSNDDLVLYYYGEPEASAEVEGHLSACSECRGDYQKLQSVLGLVEGQPVPEPSSCVEFIDVAA